MKNYFSVEGDNLRHGIMFEPNLLAIANYVREKCGKPVKVTDSARNIDEHVETYKKIAISQKNIFNIDQVPLGSRHLPSWDYPEKGLLYAGDFASDGFTGKQLADFAKEKANELGIILGIGIGNNFCHIDTFRPGVKEHVEWKYGY